MSYSNSRGILRHKQPPQSLIVIRTEMRFIKHKIKVKNIEMEKVNIRYLFKEII